MAEVLTINRAERDVLQDAVMNRVSGGLEGFDGGETFVPWLREQRDDAETMH